MQKCKNAYKRVEYRLILAGILPWDRLKLTLNVSELLGNTTTHCVMIDCSKGNFLPDLYRQLVPPSIMKFNNLCHYISLHSQNANVIIQLEC